MSLGFRHVGQGTGQTREERGFRRTELLMTRRTPKALKDTRNEMKKIQPPGHTVTDTERWRRRKLERLGFPLTVPRISNAEGSPVSESGFLTRWYNITTTRSLRLGRASLRLMVTRCAVASLSLKKSWKYSKNQVLSHLL